MQKTDYTFTMKANLFIFFIFCSLLAACDPQESGSEKKTERIDPSLDQNFQKYSAHFLEALWQVFPEWGTVMGYHQYDSVLTVPDSFSSSKKLVFCPVAFGFIASI
ncbi:MAG: hypothetical protein KL787_08280 [Taibaiella sp.]|nr:hypothetical protein [Taibaiella sp.]MBX9449694.1 hypothetical protein [Taibaiella sp.]